MVSSEGVGKPVLLAVRNPINGFSLVSGPHINIPSGFEQVTPPIITDDIIETTNCLAPWRGIEVKYNPHNQATANINAAIKAAQPGQSEQEVRSPRPSGQSLPRAPILTIRALIVEEVDMQQSLADRFRENPNASVPVFILYYRPVPDGASAGTCHALADALSPSYVHGDKLDFGFDEHAFMYDNFAAVEAAAKKFLNDELERWDDCGVYQLCEKSLPGVLVLVGATYDKKIGRLMDLVVVQKVVMTKEGVQYVDITESI